MDLKKNDNMDQIIDENILQTKESTSSPKMQENLIVSTLPVQHLKDNDKEIFMQEITTTKEEINEGKHSVLVNDESNLILNSTTDNLEKVSDIVPDEEDSIAKRVLRSRNSKSPTPEPKHVNEKLSSPQHINIELEMPTTPTKSERQKSPTPTTRNSPRRLQASQIVLKINEEEPENIDIETSKRNLRSRQSATPQPQQKSASRRSVSRTLSNSRSSTKDKSEEPEKEPKAIRSVSNSDSINKKVTTTRATKSPKRNTISSRAKTPTKKIIVNEEKKDDNEDELDSSQSDDEANNWITANKRKSTRTKSPRKFFDLSKKK